MIKLDINIGDTILTGKFKNKKVVVKSITKDEYGNPLINGKQIMKIRVPKLYQQNENTKMKKSELRQIIKEELLKESSYTIDKKYINMLKYNVQDLGHVYKKVSKNGDYDYNEVAAIILELQEMQKKAVQV